MRGTTLSGGLVLALLATPLVADAQPAKPARIGFLSNVAPGEFGAFREGLRALGHVEGQTYTIDERYWGATPGRIPELAADLVRSRVDLVLAVGDRRPGPSGRPTPRFP